MAKSLIVNLIRSLKDQPFGPRFVLSSFFVITLLTLMLRRLLISLCRLLGHLRQYLMVAVAIMTTRCLTVIIGCRLSNGK